MRHSAALTTATILTLYNQVNVVLNDLAVFHDDLADIATCILSTGVVKYQNIVTVFCEWRKLLVLAIPFVL
jgi:hypothetical protein